MSSWLTSLGWGVMALMMLLIPLSVVAAKAFSVATCRQGGRKTGHKPCACLERWGCWLPWLGGVAAAGGRRQRRQGKAEKEERNDLMRIPAALVVARRPGQLGAPFLCNMRWKGWGWWVESVGKRGKKGAGKGVDST